MTQRGRYAAATAVAVLGTLTVVGASVAVAGASVAATPANAPSTTRTFAGYLVSEPTTHIRTAKVTFVVPTITCVRSFSGVGPSVVIASTVVRHRYSDSGGGVAVACQNKIPTYLALPIVDGLNYNDHQVAISAGNKITLTVNYGSRTTVTLTNDTTHQVDTRTGAKSLGSAAYFGDSGVEVNHNGLGIDPFTQTSFSGATVNGRPIGSLSPVHDNWVDSKHVVLVSSGALSHNTDFTTTFRHSS